VDDLQQVFTGDNGQPYRVTAWVVLAPDGTVRLFVEVASAGLLPCRPVVRSLVVLPLQPAPARLDHDDQSP